MESIEKLRELAADINSTEIIDHLDVVGKFMFHVEWLDSWHQAFDAACNGIEAELAERYIELPLDADGVPIHLGDEVRNDGMPDGFTVYEISFTDNDGTRIYADDGVGGLSGFCLHVKPRTIEDVLTDFAEEWLDVRAADSNALIAKYAEELRGMIGGE